jgi:polyhydroxyalkanoate synthesis regulator phasin
MKSDKQKLSKLIEEAVDKGATTAEEITRSIAELPISILESLGFGEKPRQEVRQIQDTTIGAIYDMVRDINHNIADLADDLIKKVKAAEHELKKSDEK